MKKQALVKAAVILGGGFLIFFLIKMARKKNDTFNASGSDKKSFADDPKPTTENAEIVATAYMSALKSGESPARLTELNKECMKEFGMRCYVAEGGSVVVSDTKGETILTKNDIPS